MTANELLLETGEIEKRVQGLRLTEIETREHIRSLVREIFRRGIWKEAGSKSLQAYCIKYLGYRAKEARELAIHAGAILRAIDLRVDDPIVQRKIDRLKEWRRMRAKKEGIAAYRIFSNRTLLEIANASELKFESLMNIKGLGFSRVQSYGRELIALFQEFAPLTHESISLPLV